jgi:NAD(P)-dependent dehydrogenase (short-subunit alcohol dehydrogenase family)
MGRRGGHIVNIGDVATRKAWPSYIPYTLSKAGIVALTRSLAVVLRPQRIAVNCVAPGAVLRPESFSRARWRAVTRGHEGSAEDVAAAVASQPARLHRAKSWARRRRERLNPLSPCHTPRANGGRLRGRVSHPARMGEASRARVASRANGQVWRGPRPLQFQPMRPPPIVRRKSPSERMRMKAL